MKCPMCEIHTKCNWLGGDSFQCQDCGFFFSSPKDSGYLIKRQKEEERLFNTCPYCDMLTDGIGDNLENLDNIIRYDKKPRMAHPGCIEQNTKEENNRKVIEEKQIALLNKVSMIPCPHCGELGIYLESDNYYPDFGFLRPYWCCINCDNKVDKRWLMTQVHQVTVEVKINAIR